MKSPPSNRHAASDVISYCNHKLCFRFRNALDQTSEQRQSFRRRDTRFSSCLSLLSHPDCRSTVYGTMCDVRWLDTSIDPNGRRPGWCYLGDPRAVNTSPAGLGRYSSLRSWLSQWSYDLSNAKGAKNAARVRRTPVLQVENLADDAVPASHNPTIRSALATADKEYIGIEGATHYYQNQPAQLQQCIGAVLNWSRRKGLLVE